VRERGVCERQVGGNDLLNDRGFGNAVVGSVRPCDGPRHPFTHHTSPRIYYGRVLCNVYVQGYFAQPPPPLGTPYDSRHRRTVGSYGGPVSYERGNPTGP